MRYIFLGHPYNIHIIRYRCFTLDKSQGSEYTQVVVNANVVLCEMFSIKCAKQETIVISSDFQTSSLITLCQRVIFLAVSIFSSPRLLICRSKGRKRAAFPPFQTRAVTLFVLNEMLWHSHVRNLAYLAESSDGESANEFATWLRWYEEV